MLPPFSKRVGFALIAVGIALVLISVTSGTPSFYNQFGGLVSSTGQTLNSFPNSMSPLSFTTICCGSSYETPQNAFLVKFSEISSPLHVYLFNANTSLFQYSAGIYPQPNISSFEAYFASHESDLIANYTISPGSTRTIQYIPNDIGFLSVIITNPYSSQLNFSYSTANGSVKLAEGVGLVASALTIGVGAILAVLGIVVKRRAKPTYGL
jgi:hypothetical protein